MDATGTRIVLVINPSSGKGKGAARGVRAERALRAAGAHVRTVIGRDAADAARLARAALDAALAAAAPAGAPVPADASGPAVPAAASAVPPRAALVLAGGDGMVNLGLQLVAGTGVPLGVIPAGTGNDAARFLGVPLDDPEAAARVVLGGRTERFDLGRVAGADAAEPRWFGNVLACGLDSKVNERANRMRRPRGPSRYTLALLLELGPFRALPFTLDVDGDRRELRGMLIAVGNGPTYGGGMRICPEADPRDGRFQLTVVDRVGKPRLLTIFPRVFTGRHVEHPKVTVLHGAAVTLASAAAEPVSVWADGERVGLLPARCETVPGALTAFVPPDFPA